MRSAFFALAGASKPRSSQSATSSLTVSLDSEGTLSLGIEMSVEDEGTGDDLARIVLTQTDIS